MKNIWLITNYTIREAYARKLIVAFSIISTISLVLAALIFAYMDAYDFIPADETGITVAVISKIFIAITIPISSLALLLSIFATANFMTTIMERGVVDVFLSKPIRRAEIFFGRFLGGLIVVLVNIAYLIIGLWLIISLKFGLWDLSFLTIILTVTYVYIALYVIILMLSVWTRSSIAGMMGAYFVFIILSPLLSKRNEISYILNNDTLRPIFDTLYFITPKTTEIMEQMSVSLFTGEGYFTWEPILSTLLFIIVMMGIGMYIFQKKNF